MSGKNITTCTTQVLSLYVSKLFEILQGLFICNLHIRNKCFVRKQTFKCYNICLCPNMHARNVIISHIISRFLHNHTIPTHLHLIFATWKLLRLRKYILFIYTFDIFVITYCKNSITFSINNKGLRFVNLSVT